MQSNHINEQDQREEMVFEAALPLPPAQRAEYLDQACADDPELRRRVEGLLGALERAGEFLNEPAVSVPAGILDAPFATGEQVGDKIGAYKLLQRLGEGGCGVVYMAEQEEPVRRRIALKILKPGMDTKSVIARFAAERQALAMMDHPNIANFFDAGVTETRRPYFVMELVRGSRITDYGDRNDLDTTARLNLFIQVCRAVQHAHQKGIIHRDLKPSNILITLHDGMPVPKVIDFGIAKALQGRLTNQTLFTACEQFIGTPAYMSPEQAELSGLDIDTRSDIYSLGVLLYELLTGQTPFETKTLLAAGWDEMRRIIREQEPVRPSTRLTQLRLAAHPPTANRQSPIANDLDWIVLKCLEKDRTRRYESADGLARDIQRYLSSEPVTARPPSALYRFQKAWRRHRVAFTAATAVVIALVVGVSVSAWLANVALKTNKQLRLHTYIADIGLAHKALLEGNLGRARALLWNYEPNSPQAELSGFEWRWLTAQTKGNYSGDLGLFCGSLGGIALSPNGQFVALTRADPPRLEILQFPLRQVVKSVAMPHTHIPLACSRSGKWLAAGLDNRVWCWDTASWEAREPLPLSFPLAFGHGTNEEIFVAYATNHLEVWSSTQWRKLGELTNLPLARPLLDPSIGTESHAIKALAVSADDTVVYLSSANAIRRWDLRQRQELSSFPLGKTTCLATSGDGQLAAAETNGKVHFLNPQTGEHRYAVRLHTGYITEMRFSQDGTILVSAGTDRKVVVYDQRLSIPKLLLGHETEVMALDLSADARSIVSGAIYGGNTLVWSLAETNRPEVDLSQVKRCALLADSRILIQRDPTRPLEYYDPIVQRIESIPSPRLVQTINERDAKPFVVSPNAQWVLVGSSNALAIWNLSTDSRVRNLIHPLGSIYGALFSPDSAWLLTTGDAETRLWCTSDWTSYLLHQPDPWILSMGFSGNSQWIVIAGVDGFVRVWSLAPEWREYRWRPEPDTGIIFSVALSRNGHWLATGSPDNIIRLWDLTTGQRIGSLQGHTQGVISLSFSPDDRTLASSSASKLILWQIPTGQELLNIDEEIPLLQFAPNGQYLAALGEPFQRDRPQFIWSGQGGLRLWLAPRLMDR